MFLPFQSPWLLLLLPLLALAAWLLPRLALTRPLRAVAAVLLVVALAGPRCSRTEPGLDLVVLVDRSASVQTTVEPNQREWIELLERSRPDDRHRLQVWDVAARAQLRPGPREAQPLAEGEALESRLPSAVITALAARDPQRATRLLLLSDGAATEGWPRAADQLLAAGVPFDLRPIPPPLGPDFQADALHTPQRVRPGEPFVIRAAASGPPGGQATLLLLRDDEEIHRQPLQLDDSGLVSLSFRERLAAPGAHRYRLRLLPPADAPPDLRDAVPGNDELASWTEVSVSQRILLLTKHPDDPIARYLGEQGFQVDLALLPGQPPQPPRIAGAEAVILNNVPADEVTDAFRRTLAFAVKEQGTGLLMVGGRESFGSGGWYASPLDPLLPVSMELKEEHRRLATAMAIALDRSGSMTADAGNGRIKMDLAAEGAARAVELLGAQDQVAVFAVDTAAHEIVGLTSLQDRAGILQAIRGIHSGGGGIFLHEALQACWDALQRSDLTNRHLILFADAADTENPGGYRQILAAAAAAGVQTSVIGLGTEQDQHAELLREVATLGGGRCLFTSDATRLPELFAQETVALARSAFLQEVTATQPTGAWSEIVAAAPEWLAEVDGYNLCYLRPDARSALLSHDEYTAPLLAWRQAGLGRSAAITFPLGDEFSERARAWPALGDTLQGLVRWLAGDPLPPDLALRTRIEGQELVAEAWLDTAAAPGSDSAGAPGSDSAGAARSAPPDLVVALGEDAAEHRALAWQRLEPGHFTLRQPLPPGRTVRGALQWGDAAIPFGPLAVGAEAEWRQDPQQRRAAEALSQASGGRQRQDLREAWQALPTRLPRPILLPLLLPALLLFLVDALFTRTGWQLPRLARARARRPAPVDTAPAVARQTSSAPPAPPAPSQAEAELASAANRRERFRRAQRR